MLNVALRYKTTIKFYYYFYIFFIYKILISKNIFLDSLCEIISTFFSPVQIIEIIGMLYGVCFLFKIL